MAYNPYLPGLEPINTMNNPPYMGNKFAEQLTLPGMNNMNSGYPWSMQGEGASPNSWMTGKTAFLPSDKRHGILQTLDNQVQEGLFMNDANKLQYQNLLRQDTEGFNKGKWDRTLPADRYVNAGNVMNDANILQPDFSKVNKASMIPEGFIDKMKSLYGGITNTDAAQTMNTGNKYANLEDEAWANKQVIRTPGGEIVVDTESGQVAPDIAGFPGEEIQETETVTDPDWDRHMRMINSESAEEEGILAPNKWQQFLSKYTRQPYRGAQRHTRDFTPAQLNRMNALGGWYSEPARQQRRDRRSVATLLARKAAAEAGQGTWTTASQKNLNLKTMGSRPGHYDRPGGDPTPRGTDTPASGPGGWGPGAARGGVMGVF